MGSKHYEMVFNHTRIDISITTEKGNVTGFSVNLSMLIDDKGVDVVRWDTSHGFLHKHEFWRTHRCIRTKKYESTPLDVVLAEVKEEVIKNKEKYIRRMLEYKNW